MRDAAAYLLALTALYLSGLPAQGQDYPKLAPYAGIRWEDPSPEVYLDGTWYELRSIDGLSISVVAAFARETYGARWQKRFDEDLVQVLSEMGYAPGASVRLVLGDIESGSAIAVEKAPLTEANRDAIMRRKYGGGPRQRGQAELGPEQLNLALDHFETALTERWAYCHANTADFEGAIASLRQRVDAGIAPDEFVVALQRIIALGIDGHAAIDPDGLTSASYLPFLTEPLGDRFVAFLPDRTGFVAEALPYIETLDGRPIQDWYAAAAELVPKGSPQYVRRHALRHLRHINYLRNVLGMTSQGTVTVELTNLEGSRRKTISLPLADTRPSYGIWPRGDSRLLDGNVGYLRLSTMDADDSVAEVRRAMAAFRDTNGLIIDVRDNGGGSRDALLALHAYLAAPGDTPRVVNAAKYSLNPEHPRDHLAVRYMYRADDERWTDAERRAIEQFAETFEPEWAPPEDRFSEWHYLVLSGSGAAGAYHYEKPVVALMNAKCFSATDIFLAGLKGMKNVTLLGTPSGGGSARSQKVRLGDTSFILRIASMASFQANGRLFDGNGVQPDVMVWPTPDYFIGGADHVLAKALERIVAR